MILIYNGDIVLCVVKINFDRFVDIITFDEFQIAFSIQSYFVEIITFDDFQVASSISL